MGDWPKPPNVRYAEIEQRMISKAHRVISDEQQKIEKSGYLKTSLIERDYYARTLLIGITGTGNTNQYGIGIIFPGEVTGRIRSLIGKALSAARTEALKGDIVWASGDTYLVMGPDVE